MSENIKVGDYVRILDNAPYDSGNNIGNVVQVIALSKENMPCYYVRTKSQTRSNGIYADRDIEQPFAYMCGIDLQLIQYPKICELLKVKLDEPFYIKGENFPYTIKYMDNYLVIYNKNNWQIDSLTLIKILEHPELIYQKVKLSKELEVTLQCFKVNGWEYVSRDFNSNNLYLWKDKPKFIDKKYEPCRSDGFLIEFLIDNKTNIYTELVNIVHDGFLLEVDDILENNIKG